MGKHIQIIKGKTPVEVKSQLEKCSSFFQQVYGLYEESRSEEPCYDEREKCYVAVLVLHS